MFPCSFFPCCGIHNLSCYFRDLYSSFKYCFYPANFKGLRVKGLIAFANWMSLKCIFVEIYKKMSLCYSFKKCIDFALEKFTSSKISRNTWETQLNFWCETLEFGCCKKHTFFFQSCAYTSLVASSFKCFILAPSQASLFFFPFLGCYLFLSVRSWKRNPDNIVLGELVHCTMSAFILSSYISFEDLCLI